MIIRHGRLDAYWADSLSDDELSRFRAVKSDFARQAEWDLLDFVDFVACVPQ